jgi:hypothetical protein
MKPAQAMAIFCNSMLDFPILVMRINMDQCMTG